LTGRREEGVDRSGRCDTGRRFADSPQKPPLGMTMESTFGMSLLRSESDESKFDCSTSPSLIVIPP